MSLKSWVLDRLHRLQGAVGRPDLPPREPTASTAFDELSQGPAERSRRTAPAPLAEPALPGADPLGAYAPLIAAVRDELEHFVASQVRQHVVIADRDRFVLTSLAVRTPGEPAARQLLQQFMHEFKPEQIKRYLAREVIGGLPNAAAIDLTQFAGLFDADAIDGVGEADEYGELIAALRSTPPTPAVRSYEVTVLGRWTESEPARTPASPVPGKAAAATPATPLAGLRCEFDVEDAGGPRRIVLQSVVPGRRYIVGKGEDADLRVDGTYTSRRHAELWLERGAWWVMDAGSTNGTRVEADAARGSPRASIAGHPVELGDGARVVLSARAEGPARDYPAVALRVAARASVPLTPIASAPLRTPSTEVLPPRVVEPRYEITALQASGTQSLEVGPSALPLSVGRSRNQTLVVDRRHEGVSGHHLDIVAFDDSGAEAVVHGDNGVRVDGVEHAPGTRFHWRLGDTLVLGAAPTDAPPCWLTLMRSEPAAERR